MVDIRLFHPSQKLPGVRRERFHVSSLPFGKDRVERKAALARSRDARDDSQRIPRDADVEVLQIVFASAADDDVRFVHVSIVELNTGASK